MKFKNNSIAYKFRLKGNENYKSLQFSEALVFYNKSLCYAVPTSVEFALCFANRSAVYFEIEEYEVCIENIQLAIDFGYPKDKIHILLDRMERCEELMQNYTNKSHTDFFKLSYPANSKIPHIVDCVAIKNSECFGRHLVTTRSLKAGDVIAIERPFYKFIMNSSRFTHCANCLKCEKLNLFPCCDCNYTMFCCKECMTIGQQRFHQFECKVEIDTEIESGIFQINHRMVFEALGLFERIEKLKLFLEEHAAQPKTLFDFDCIDNEKNLLLSSYFLQQNPLPKELDSLMNRHCTLMMSITKNEKHKKFLNKFMRHQMEILITNTFGLVESSTEIGSGIFPFASYFNHSCSPNVCRITLDGQLVFIASRPIEKNHQLFVCYRNDFLSENCREKRQEELLKSYRFTCVCEACRLNYETLENLPKIDAKFKDVSEESREQTVEDFIEEYKENCAYINAHHTNFPSYEICKVIERNQHLLNSIVYFTSSCLKINRKK